MYERYAKLRDEHGLTDYQVSAQTGIAVQTLSAWKHNLYTPKLDKLMKIAKLLDTTIEELVET